MSYNVKIGDIFEIKDNSKINCGSYTCLVKARYILVTDTKKENGDIYSYIILDSKKEKISQCYSCISLEGCSDNLIKVNNYSNSNMNIIEKFKLALKPEPEKSFLKKGITDTDGMLTSEGTSLYLSWKLSQDKKAFNDEVISKIELDEEKK